jgi:hypothetical protein
MSSRPASRFPMFMGELNFLIECIAPNYELIGKRQEGTLIYRQRRQ